MLMILHQYHLILTNTIVFFLRQMCVYLYKQMYSFFFLFIILYFLVRVYRKKMQISPSVIVKWWTIYKWIWIVRKVCYRIVKESVTRWRKLSGIWYSNIIERIIVEDTTRTKNLVHYDSNIVMYNNTEARRWILW